MKCTCSTVLDVADLAARLRAEGNEGGHLRECPEYRPRAVMNSSALPGTMVDIQVSHYAPPTLEHFLNRKFDRGLIEEARYAVRALREHAERLGQFTVTDDSFEYRGTVSGRTVTKAYFGESGKALNEAHKIQQTVNHYIARYIYGDVERDRLRIR